MMPPETPNFHRFSEPSSTPRSSSRPVPHFLEESKTFSTKKVNILNLTLFQLKVN